MDYEPAYMFRAPSVVEYLRHVSPHFAARIDALVAEYVPPPRPARTRLVSPNAAASKWAVCVITMSYLLDLITSSVNTGCRDEATGF